MKINILNALRILAIRKPDYFKSFICIWDFISKIRMLTSQGNSSMEPTLKNTDLTSQIRQLRTAKTRSQITVS